MFWVYYQVSSAFGSDSFAAVRLLAERHCGSGGGVGADDIYRFVRIFV